VVAEPEGVRKILHREGVFRDARHRGEIRHLAETEHQMVVRNRDHAQPPPSTTTRIFFVEAIPMPFSTTGAACRHSGASEGNTLRLAAGYNGIGAMTDETALSAVTFKPRPARRCRLVDMEHAIQPSTSSSALIQSRASDLMLSLMSYKRWADAALLAAARSLPDSFPELERGYVLAIIRHYHTVDCIFRAHLIGVTHEYTSPNPSEPATLSELQQRVATIDDWYVGHASKLDERELGQVLNVKFTDGQEQTLSRSDILLHVSQHGTGHRGQVALLMQMRGIQPPPDRFPNYLRSVSRH
jgi:uncharacterized damage-inducible protein DinB